MTTTVATASQTLTAITPEIHKIAPITGWTSFFGVEINPSVIVFLLVVCIVIYFLWKAQRDGRSNTFNVWDFTMNRLPNGSRETSIVKSTYAAAFLVSTWVIVDEQIKGTLTEGIFGLWLTAWVAPLVTKLVKGDTAIVPALPEVK